MEGLTAEEAEVLTEALEAAEVAHRFGAGLADGDERQYRFRRATVARRLLRMVDAVDALDECRHGKRAGEDCGECDT